MTVLALDVGGSTVRGVVRDTTGRTIATEVVATGDRDPGLNTLRRIACVLRDAARDAGTPVDAVGVGMPEYVDQHGQLTSRDVLDWTEQPAVLLADVAPIVVVESDVRCAAEAELDARPDAGDVVVITLGTGLSHAVIRNGAVVRGARGEAIGLGQLPVGDPRLGLAPNIEDIASGAGLVRQYQRRTGQTVGDGARELLRRCEEGDVDASAVLREAGDALAYAAWVVVQLLDPDRLVLTGGLGSAPSLLPERMRTSFVDLTRSRPGAVSIEVSQLGDRAGLVGATLIARRALE